MRFFNTAGPVEPERHYCLPPLSRLDLDELLSLINQRKYFVLHAPRQTGKTSCLLALRDHLNKSGQYRALYANVEIAQSAREDVGRAIRTIIGQIAGRAEITLQDRFVAEHMDEAIRIEGPDGALNAVLGAWAQSSPLPIVLMIDEIDALVGDSLISVLRQVRAGYDERPRAFPQSVILCGVRDVRDYRIHASSEKDIITGGSAFNIRSESLRLGDFSRQDIETLYSQHTEETGQVFEKAALDAAWQLTEGQPWIVNALAYEACSRMPEGKDRSRPITAEMISQAKENIILRRETHLDQLADKLREDRVRRVIEPMLAGEFIPATVPEDDILYCLDLGLVRRTNSGVQVANPIYAEIIPRQLTVQAQTSLESIVVPEWYKLPDGRLDMDALLTAFQEFFRENSEAWSAGFAYKEIWPHILLMAFLQRVVNHGGRIHREYAVGRGRMDILVEWPGNRLQAEIQSVGRAGAHDVSPASMPVVSRQRFVIELKILRKSLEQTLVKGLEQTAGYMDRVGDAEGHLIIFDQRPGLSWDERIYRREETCAGRAITVWGM
jgi:hypothetical protein